MWKVFLPRVTSGRFMVEQGEGRESLEGDAEEVGERDPGEKLF